MTATIACPLCHHLGPVQTEEALRTVGWRCARCGQRWDAGRLAAVAGYAAWLIEHDRRPL
jgi:hypothetical protein